ncbi:MAG: NUDIX hydrolase [Bacteroidales bacterium]|nr:NUDIX hydrolase [Bacteroidales bacterium]
MNQAESYNKNPRHLLSVECVIFGYEEEQLKVLLCPRGFSPSYGQWALLGGFVRANETLDDAARRILLNSMGLSNIFQEQVYTFSKLDRDPVDRVVSVAYYALIKINEHDKDLVREHCAHWWPISKLPALAFDHREMVDAALGALQRKAVIEMVGKDLLDDLFTLGELKKLYESIFQKEFDNSNFRKKILSMNILEKTNKKDKNDSRRGSFYYKFKPEEEISYKKNEILVRI